MQRRCNRGSQLAELNPERRQPALVRWDYYEDPERRHLYDG